MDRRHRSEARALAAATMYVLFVSGLLAAQTPAATDNETDAEAWEQPRTAWGDPDLQGVWRYEATIALERPAGVRRTGVADRHRDGRDRASGRGTCG